jgi:RimJ/RimL family protein N-acetyltransferase
LIQATDRTAVQTFFADRLGLKWSDDFRGVLHVPDMFKGATASMDHVAVAVGYNGFIGRTCCMHVVIQKPEAMSPRIVREAFEFPFNVCNCTAVLGMVDSVNAAALDFDRRLGFVEIDRIPEGALEGDLVIFRMTRAECRWLRAH